MGKPHSPAIKYELKVQSSTHKYDFEQGIHCLAPTLSVAPLISAPLCASGKPLPLTCGFFKLSHSIIYDCKCEQPVCTLLVHTHSHIHGAPSLFPTLVF